MTQRGVKRDFLATCLGTDIYHASSSKPLPFTFHESMTCKPETWWVKNWSLATAGSVTSLIFLVHLILSQVKQDENIDDFQGTTRKKRKLEAESTNVNILQLVREWQKQQQISPAAAMKPVLPESKEEEQELYNPYETKFGARKLAETIPEFIKRMPPLTSLGDGAWIWIANPTPKGKGNGPKGENTTFNLERFEELGRELTQQFDSDRVMIEKQNVGKVQSTITRKLGPHRDKLKEDILDTAIEYGVTSGKARSLPTPVR